MAKKVKVFPKNSILGGAFYKKNLVGYFILIAPIKLKGHKQSLEGCILAMPAIIFKSVLQPLAPKQYNKS